MDPVHYFLSPEGFLQCPEDEIVINPQISTVDELQKNFALLRLLTKHTEGRKQLTQKKEEKCEDLQRQMNQFN